MSAGKILRKHVLQIKQRLSHREEKVKTDSVQGSSNKWKNYLLKNYSQHINFLNTIKNLSL